MSKRPINGWWTRSVVCDQHNLFKFELLNDCVDIQRLIRGCIGVSGGFGRFPPPKKIKGHDPAGGREPGKKAIIEMHIVWEAMHQDDRGLLPWILAHREVIGTALYDVFGGR
jgi:hypothetical protein